MIPIKSSEITPEHVFNNRRQFMKGVGAAAIGAVVLAACAPATVATPAPTAAQDRLTPAARLPVGS